MINDRIDVLILLFYIVWGSCGIWGAGMQRDWYARHEIKQRMPNLDFVTNGMLGPVALLACWVAYGND